MVFYFIVIICFDSMFTALLRPKQIRVERVMEIMLLREGENKGRYCFITAFTPSISIPSLINYTEWSSERTLMLFEL